jgi:predicted ATP-dependent endonuclease of OLD family
MRLSKVEIWNYRSIKHISLDLGDCTIIVGKNNSGKSNIIHAIDLIIGEKWLKFTKEDFFDNDETQNIKVHLHFDDFSATEIDSIIPEIKGCKVDGIWCSAERYQDEFRASAKLLMELEVSADHQISKRIYYGNSEYNYLSPKVKDLVVNSVLIPAIRDHSQMLKTTYDNNFFSKLLSRLYAIADPTKKQIFDNKLKEINVACKDLYLEHEERLNEISKEIIDHDGVVFSVTPGNPKDTYKKLEILLIDGMETDLNLKGSGIQSVIIIALFKLYSELRVEGNALLLVEEPESFLHPHANRHMASILRGFCGQQGVQVIITTHSPQYLLDQKISNIALISKSGKETKVQQVRQVTDEVKLKRELTDSNLELFFSEKVVLVEGPSEKLLFPNIARSINNEYDFDKKNISLIEVDGKTNLDVFINLCNAFNIQWLAIVDKDFSDTSQTFRALKRLNIALNIGVDFTNDSRQDIERKFDAKNIHVLNFGAIENYYHKEWLLEMLYDLLITSGIPQEFLDQSVPLVKQFNDPTKEIELKQTIGSIADLDPDDRAFIFDVINAKLKILALNLDSPTITSELVAAFKSFSLTKPKIALMLKRHATITDFTTPKNSELQDVFNRIFT